MWGEMGVKPCRRFPAFRSAFTLIEMLVATSVFILLLALTLSVVTQTSQVWRRANQQMDAFVSARAAFDSLTSTLSQATLNTYWDVKYQDGRPTKYSRSSELQFISGPAGAGGLPGTPGTGQAVFFQAPASFSEAPSVTGSLDQLLNACGYYVEFGSDAAWLPDILPTAATYRFRLMQMLVPAEKNFVYDTAGPVDLDWIDEQKSNPLAKNIIALVVQPQQVDKNGDVVRYFSYNSREGAVNIPQPPTANQLAPRVEVTMIAIDEVSAQRLTADSSIPPKIAAALQGKFTDVTKSETDLEEVEKSLQTAGINYKVFRRVILIRTSKWSES